jgi:flagellar hook-associated protein 3 FlgL
MGGITSIPSTRVSDNLMRQRLMSQLQFDQLELFRLQNQLSTGNRIFAPSEDPQAAGRAISLQRLLERKGQIKENLSTNQTFLTATDTALSTTSSLLSDLRGAVLAVASSTASDDQRQAVIQQVEAAIEQLTDIGNSNFRGRYLFSGSRTAVQPFDRSGEFVQYLGNERKLQSLADLDQLFDTNFDGNQVFGAISSGVLGLADLTPVVTENTRLTDLRLGQGITRGSIAISDGFSTATIDLAGAETLGDVTKILERGFLAAQPPTSNRLVARITNTGLSLQLTGGSLTVTEVAGGTVARQLGILQETGIGTSLLTSEDLNPQVTLTTSLGDVLGTRAQVLVPVSGAANNLVIRATDRGAAFNDVQVIFANGAIPGSETAVYDDSDPLNKTLTVTLASGISTANQVLDAINAQVPQFRADLDTKEAGNDGSGPVFATAPGNAGITAGGSGIELDLASGLQIINGGETHTISLAAAQSVQDVINILNASGAGVVAAISDNRTSIQVRSVLSGTDFAIGENGGATASQLGIRSLNTSTLLADLNHGAGVHRIDGRPDLTITLDDGTPFDIDLSAAQTVGDALTAIAAQTGGAVTASLVEVGNGIRLRATDSTGAAGLTVRKANGSQAAIDLGLIPVGQETATATAAGGIETLNGRDVNPGEVKGVFTALFRLRTALRDNDPILLQRASGLLDDGLTQVNLARADVGARQQQLDLLNDRIDGEAIELKASISTEIEADLATVISDFAARQATFQASLQATAKLLQLTLLDYL